jgi:hypothetical protein
MSMKVNTPDGWERNVGQIRFMSNPPNDVRWRHDVGTNENSILVWLWLGWGPLRTGTGIWVGIGKCLFVSDLKVGDPAEYHQCYQRKIIYVEGEIIVREGRDRMSSGRRRRIGGLSDVTRRGSGRGGKEEPFSSPSHVGWQI